ncbi:MAG: MetQ/NlpA family ABC transporter substrate-binding protein [Lachnospiraceae bacterium]|nr:MetQ/NlpA family ABC transporter substrate-binding protein [Lachnospiraceae bacterium]
MKKRVFCVLLTVVFAAGLIAGCGKSQAGNDKIIKVAASETPHSEILNQAKDKLKEQGYDLQVTVFEDYVQPNNVVEQGEFDANYFQHINYLNSFNEENGTSLVVADNGKIHYEPFGIYAGTKTSLADLADGDSIAIPNDTTNEARALLLLEQEGLIRLEDGAGVTATVNQVAENPKNLELVEVEAAQVPKQLKSVAFGVINGNYALEAGLNVGKDALAVEAASGEAIQQYVNIIAVKKGNESSEKIKALTSVLKSDAIVSYIKDTYEGAVVPYDGE